MSNMSYCRFENAYNNLLDCADNMDDVFVSHNEADYRRRLIALCVEIALDYGHEVRIEINENS